MSPGSKSGHPDSVNNFLRVRQGHGPFEKLTGSMIDAKFVIFPLYFLLFLPAVPPQNENVVQE